MSLLVICCQLVINYNNNDNNNDNDNDYGR